MAKGLSTLYYYVCSGNYKDIKKKNKPQTGKKSFPTKLIFLPSFKRGVAVY